MKLNQQKKIILKNIGQKQFCNNSNYLYLFKKYIILIRKNNISLIYIKTKELVQNIEIDFSNIYKLYKNFTNEKKLDIFDYNLIVNDENIYIICYNDDEFNEFNKMKMILQNQNQLYKYIKNEGFFKINIIKFKLVDETLEHIENLKYLVKCYDDLNEINILYMNLLLYGEIKDYSFEIFNQKENFDNENYYKSLYSKAIKAYNSLEKYCDDF